MTPGGTIMGSYLTGDFFAGTLVSHGFLRTIDGNFTPFDAPHATQVPSFFFFAGTGPTSINNSGVVTGFYFDATQSSKLRVFLRASDGTFSSFDTPQLGNVPGSASINSSGAVAGNVQNCSNFPCTFISFLRTANGAVNPVNDPVQGGTAVIGINPAGVVFGNYIDENNVQHGFVRTP